VVLSVTDTGQGIREEDLSKICEPFYTTKAPGAGSGLGLSMVYGFVAQSGGALEIQSCVGTGTTINLYFQALDIERTTFSQHPTQDERVARTQYHILLAEDHEDVRRMLERSLSRMGHKVTSAENGDKALALFDADPQVDLLLTDIVMPGRLQGTDLVKALRERRTNFPAIVMTGYTDVPLHEGSVLNTDDIRLSKPVARASLEAAIAITMKRIRSF
jgi:CheY-like chemotaxis protein